MVAVCASLHSTHASCHYYRSDLDQALCYVIINILSSLPQITHRSFFHPFVFVPAGLIAHLYTHPSYNPTAVGPLELANALAACCLSSRLSSGHRQWAAQQLVRTLAAHDRDNQSRPQTFADMAGDLRKCSSVKLEAHQSRVSTGRVRGGGLG